jgi:hypothetical protein
MSDEARLRYIAEHPEVLRYLYDVLGCGNAAALVGYDKLAVLRATLDFQIKEFPDAG